MPTQTRQEREAHGIRRGATLLTGALALVLAAPAGAATFIAFHSPGNNGQSLGTKPNALPLEIPVGASGVVHLYVENYEATGPVPSGVDGGGKPRACVDGAGTEVCGLLLLVAGSGIRIDSFVDAAGGAGSFVSTLGAGALKVAGGSAGGQSGPVAVGTLGITALASNGTLEVRPGSWLDAAGRLQQPAVRTVAATIDTCGNGTLEVPPEQCDDGNQQNGDGCFKSCKRESSLTLTGTAAGGSIVLGFDERTGLLSIPTIPGEPASAVANRIAMLMNDDAQLAAAGRAAASLTGAIVVTDAAANSAVSNDGGLVIALPEPGGLVPLLAGGALLQWMARRRRRRASWGG